MKKKNWKKYAFEFLSIFIAVISAFALNNWNDNRRDSRAESKILTEILNGLEKDREDISLNIIGHEQGIKSCIFWREIFSNQKPNLDTLQQHYFMLTRDFISIQNTSGYEALKSRGFELIKNDSLREHIISLYEFDYQTIEKLEEEYNEMQFHSNYFSKINSIIAPHFEYDLKGNISEIELPLTLIESDRKIVLSYLWSIQVNRKFVLKTYQEVYEKVGILINEIEKELKE
ncbi:hypothetical protein [Ascidiimonas sp. W6]|uniref:hypothetical protein n=1 Tax=Ascidiimonas meishanensis TaxID=3128903 RepID=UPI0030ECB67D